MAIKKHHLPMGDNLDIKDGIPENATDVSLKS